MGQGQGRDMVQRGKQYPWLLEGRGLVVLGQDRVVANQLEGVVIQE